MRSNRFVSYLGTEIEPSAIKNLNSFERATERAFQRIEAFSNKGAAKLAFSGGIDPRTNTQLSGATSALSRARAEAARTAPAVARVAAETNRMAVGFNRAGQSLSVVQGALGPFAGRLNALGTIFRDLSGLSLAGVLGGAGAFALGTVASDYQRVTDRLRPFYETQKQTNAAMRDVIGIARDTRQALDPVAQLYTKLNQAGKDAGLKIDNSRLTETVAKAARLSGGDADTQANGLTQFAQGFGSGSLSGDELKSIRENTFRLAKALADGLGVPIAKLKQLGADGKLTPQIIAQALARASDQIDLEFSRLPKRIGASLTEAGNNLGVFIGRLDETTHATQGIAEAISALGGNLGNTVTGLSALAGIFAARSLSGGIDRAASSLVTFTKVQAGALAGTVVPLTPRTQQLGRNAFQANSARDQSLAAATAARQEVASQQAIVAELKAKQAQIIATGATDKEANVVARAAAAAEVEAIETQIIARKADAAQISANILLIEKQRIESAQAAAQAKLSSQIGLGRLGIARDTPAAGRGEQDRKAELVYKRELAAINAQVAESELALGAAVERRVAVTANGNAVSGLAAMEARAAVTIQAAAAEAELAAATAAANAATAASIPTIAAASVAQRAYEASLKFTARAQVVLLATGQKMLALLGGPLGIALAAITAGMVFFGTRTDEAKEAADRFNAAQDALATKLGSSGAAFEKAANAAAGYRLELAKAGLAEAKRKQGEVQSSLSDSLETAAVRINPLYAQGREDISKLRALAAASRNGNISSVGNLATINALRARNPEAFASSSVAGFFNSNPADVGIKAVGYKQATIEVGDAQNAVAEAQKRTKAKPAAPINFDGPTRRTTEQLRAYAADAAEGGTKMAQAREKYAKTVADLDAKLTEKRKAGDFSFDEEYVRQLTAAKTELNRTGDAERSATAARVAGAKATAEATKATKDRIAREEALANILQRYSGEESAFNSGQIAQNKVESLFRTVQKGGKVSEVPTITVDGEAITKAQALARIVEGMNKPYTDLVRNQQQALDIGNLRLRGLGDQADALEQQLDLERALGINREKGQALSQEQVATLRRQQVEQRKLNDATEKRNAAIEFQAQSIGNVVDAVRGLIANPLDAGNIAKTLLSQFRQQVAQKFVLTVLGDPEKEFRDQMTRGLDLSAENLTTAATNLTAAANAIVESASNPPAAASTDLAATPSSPAAQAVASIVPRLQVDMGALMKDAGVTFGSALTEEVGDIVVTARKREKETKDPQKMSVEQMYNDAGARIATKAFGPNSLFTKAASKLGTFLSGSGTGLAFQGATGIGGKGVGAQIGGAIGGGLGKTLLGGKNGLFTQGLTAISSKLGSFAGPLGSIAGSIIGSLAGGLFQKRTSSTATVTGQRASDVNASGTSKTLTSGANSLGQSVQSGVQQIADALGGNVGNYAVSIGTYKDKYRVSTTGYDGRLGKQGSKTDALGIVDFGKDGADAAVQYAVLNALQDGAIKGIREGAKRLLQSGQNLTTALNKALAFSNVFKELKQFTDPVGAAIDDLNVQFTNLIDIFNEAGASSAEFADLQKLYDLKRADAVKNATNGALSNIQDFIDNLKSGNDSPLSRRAVYNNAKTNVDAFRSDLAAGKAVDSDKLLDSLSKLQDASGKLNGRGSSFFTDFNDILALAEKAKANITTGTTSSGSNTPSPFTDAVKAQTSATVSAIGAGAAAQVAATDANTKAVQALADALGVGGSKSAIDLLSAFRA